MPVSVSIEFPDENNVHIHPDFLSAGTGFVSVKGKGNTLRIERPHLAGEASFVVENGASVTVDANCTLGSLRAYALAADASIAIGKNTAFNSVTQMTIHETAHIIIGSNCLFGPDVTIAASDVHKIYLIRNSKRTNHAGNITIGDNVWVSAKCAIFRNSSVGSGSIVGWASVVKGVFPQNVLIAGSPAKVVRKGVRWEH